MKRWHIGLTCVGNYDTEVEAETQEEAERLAYEEAEGSASDEWVIEYIDCDEDDDE